MGSGRNCRTGAEVRVRPDGGSPAMCQLAHRGGWIRGAVRGDPVAAAGGSERPVERRRGPERSHGGRESPWRRSAGRYGGPAGRWRPLGASQRPGERRRGPTTGAGRPRDAQRRSGSLCGGPAGGRGARRSASDWTPGCRHPCAGIIRPPIIAHRRKSRQARLRTQCLRVECDPVR